MFHLKTLSAILGKSLVVRHVCHKVGHIKAERLHQLCVRDLLVFDRVVQVASGDKVRVCTGVGQHRCHMRQVIEVRLGSFSLAALVCVPSCREVGGTGDDLNVGWLIHQIFIFYFELVARCRCRPSLAIGTDPAK